jgi:glycosyltransferase involved in cell wall biosynthesis
MSVPVLLFLPAHDEAASVGAVVRRVPRAVRGHPVRCVVIDDGSADATAAEAAAAGADVVSLGANRGLGAAVRAGLAEGVAMGAAAVVFCDADGEYAPEELDRLVGPILDGEADYVVGSRFAGERRRMHPHRWAGNRALTWWVRSLARRRFGVRGVTDGQSGYRALSAAAAADADVVHDFNYAQVLTLDLLAKGHRYAEVPITYAFRTTGRSFVRLVPYLRRVVPAVREELSGARQSCLLGGCAPGPHRGLARWRSRQSCLLGGCAPGPHRGLARWRSRQSSTTLSRNPARATAQAAASTVPS